ncbi:MULTISPECIES: GDSL-type esterase/lipase family protein [Acinetobacter]|uniref:GDSL-type esterase/lipase family protein n=1 Tax=Acinetobacter TaxID=469 RepID=UPI00046E4778|nr:MULTISPECIES: GDSL-type esterase/lipase family protein [Acinetobacter calcoaceticus/baumannii complex]MCW8691118.1 GDSL-type esterase/lipase family protein [Acinetobacter baumannii]MCW8767933.1 GDSL-type esterase/lipase family protein [Acinetobacter baumannii]MDC4397656.1 GDSL-type esterase/lipase family protein [Acinetobacter baumannii]MDC4869071.1 GDSL-type esterase/lipase family protein [Acinetobacter baumannii]MDC5331575.1 GDSL-type esterase/lipase family protein [Acinetobacter baumanni
MKFNKFFILIFLLMFSLLLANFFNPNISSWVKNKFNISTNSELNPYYKKMVVVHQRMDGNIREGSIFFLGDSITQSLNVNSVTDRGVNYGIGGDTSLGLLNRLEYYNSLKKADKILVAIGINDFIFNRTSKEIIGNYAKIFELLPKDKKVFINSVLPVTYQYTENSDKITINQIVDLNHELKKFCSLKSNCEFINSYGSFADSSGFLKKSYDIGDGIHLNTEGYNLLIKILKVKIN